MPSQIISLGIIFGIMSMIGWGIGDYFSALSSRRIGFVSAAFFGNVFIILTTIFILNIRHVPVSFTNKAMVLSIAAGVMHGIAGLTFYKGLEVGSVSVVSPIASAYPLILIPAVIVLFGEVLTATQAIAVIIIITGGLIVSMDIKGLVQKHVALFSDKGIPYALATAIGWGLGFIFLDYAVEDLDWIIPALILQVSIMVVYTIFILVNNLRIKLPCDKNTWIIVVLSGVFSALAYASYSIGIDRFFTSLIAPIAASFPVVTIFLAHIFLKERLSITQYLGIFAVIAGVVLLSI